MPKIAPTCDIQRIWELFWNAPDPMEREYRHSQLYCHYHPLVAKVVGHKPTRFSDRDDLLVEGELQLSGAIYQYNPARGAQFETYATHSIGSGMMHFFRNRPRLPTVSFHDIWEDEAFPWEESLCDDGPDPHAFVAAQEQRTTLEWALRQLPDNQAAVIRDYYWGDLSFPEIATKLGRSRSAPFRVHERGVCRLRELFSVSLT